VVSAEGGAGSRRGVAGAIGVVAGAFREECRGRGPRLGAVEAHDLPMLCEIGVTGVMRPGFGNVESVKRTMKNCTFHDHLSLTLLYAVYIATA
jgi:hypothetical protein